MACPACLVAIAGTDGIGAEIAPTCPAGCGGGLGWGKAIAAVLAAGGVGYVVGWMLGDDHGYGLGRLDEHRRLPAGMRSIGMTNNGRRRRRR